MIENDYSLGFGLLAGQKKKQFDDISLSSGKLGLSIFLNFQIFDRQNTDEKIYGLLDSGNNC